MGQYISMLFGYNQVEYSELPQDTSTKLPKLTKDVFKDISKYPEIMKHFASIKKDQLNVPIEDMDEFIDDLVDFVEQYIDLNKMGGKHSKLWKGYVHLDDEEERLAAIRVKVIDILKIDVEGKELDVLKSNNWEKFIPKVIICELINVDIEKLNKNPVYKLLKSKNYLLYCKLLQNGIFFHKNFSKKLFK